MKKWIFLIIIVGMLGWAIFDFLGSNKQAGNADASIEEANEDVEIGLELGNRAPDFQLETMDGESIKLSDYRGERVMLNFWASWCPPCRAEMPDMQKFYEDEDVVILAVNLTDTETSLKDVEEFIENNGLTFPVLLDTELEAADLYAIQPIPTTFMIDTNGIISFKVFGPMNYDWMIQEYEKMN